MLIIRVHGYNGDNGCQLITNTFYVRDQRDFESQVLEWERVNKVIEWSRTETRVR